MSVIKRSPPGTKNRRRVKSPAQAMVEFGLALPILLLIMYGLIETGRLVFMYASVVSAARQAARYGSVTGDNGSGTPYYNDCAGIVASAQRLGFLQRFKSTDIQIGYDNGPGAATPWSQTSCPISAAGHPVNGDRIRVRVTAPFAPILPFVPFDSFPIVSAATRTLLVGVSVEVDNPALFMPPGNTGDLTIVKTANVTSFDKLGQEIIYSYLVTNNGTGAATNVQVTDDPAGVATCPGDVLAGGGFFQCEATYVVQQTDIDNGAITNTATVTADGGHFAQAQLTMSFVPKPKLLLAKLGTPPEELERGEPMFYKFTLTNIGNVPLDSPFTIIDPNLDGPATCPPSGRLEVIGATTVTCDGVHTLTNNDISASYVDNTATATALYGSFVVTSAPVSARTFVPELALTVSALPVQVTQVGEVITYTYSLRNRTAKPMSNLKISDSRLGSFDCLASLDAGASNTCTRTYSVTQADMNAGIIVSEVEATATSGLASNRIVYSNPVTAQVDALETRKLTLTKTVTLPAGVVEPVPVGTVLTYGYTIKNEGTVDAIAPYTVTDNKIPGINCSAAPAILGPGQTTSCADALYTVTTQDRDAGSIVNTAAVSALAGGLTVKSDPVSKTVVTFAGPRLGLVKSSSPAFFTGIQTLKYTFTLVNTGSEPLSAPYTVQDWLIPNVDCTKATPTIPVGGNTTCTGSYTVTTADSTAEKVLNSATATANSSSGVVTSPPANLTVNKFVCTVARVKHLDPTPIPAGDNVTWTIVNNSNLPLHIATITITWNSGPQINNVTLQGYPAAIWTGPSTPGTNALLVGPVPAGGWLLPTGNTNMGVQFTSGATGIRIQITFVEPGCPGVDSNVKYQV